MAMIHTLKTLEEIEAEIIKISNKREFVRKQLDSIPGRIKALEKGDNTELDLDKYSDGWATPERILMLRDKRLGSLQLEAVSLKKQITAYDKRITQAQQRINIKSKEKQSNKVVDKDVAKRFIWFRKNKIDKSQNAAAMKMGVSQPSLSNVENGVIPPSSNLVNILQSKFNCNITWLLTGKGEPTTEKEDPSTLRKSMLQMQIDLQTADKRIEVLEANVNRLYKIVEKLAKG